METKNKIPPTHVQKIEGRFRFNMARIGTLVNMDAGSYAFHDVLRAAVILLHATVEDMMRSMLLWLLPVGHSDHLKKINCDAVRRLDKMTLQQLSEFDAKMTVREVITEIVRRHLDRETFNRTEDIISWFPALHLDKDVFTPKAVALNDMMKRRHEIAHRGDRLGIGEDHGQPRHINIGDIRNWFKAVDDFGHSLIEVMLLREKEMNAPPAT